MNIALKRLIYKVKPAMLGMAVYVCFIFFISEKQETLNAQIDSLLSKARALREDHRSREENARRFAEEVNKTRVAVRAHAKQIDVLEQHSKRYNLKFYGILESADENPVKLVQLLIQDTMGINLDNRSIEYGHRLRSEEVHPRPILVKFLRWKDKVRVLHRRKSLRGSLKVEEDLTKQQHKKMQQLVSYAEKAEKQGKTVKWNGKQLFVDGKEVKTNITE